MTDDLPDLTHKQFNFVQGILAGKTASDAYRAAYDCSGMLEATVWAEASRLRADRKVATWLAKARAEALTSATMTKEAYIQELLNDREACKDTGNYGAAIKALELAGKVMGHYVEKHEDVGARQGLASVLSEIETRNPALAAFLRAQGDKDDDPLTH